MSAIELLCFAGLSPDTWRYTRNPGVKLVLIRFSNDDPKDNFRISSSILPERNCIRGVYDTLLRRFSWTLRGVVEYPPSVGSTHLVNEIRKIVIRRDFSSPPHGNKSVAGLANSIDKLRLTNWSVLKDLTMAFLYTRHPNIEKCTSLIRIHRRVSFRHTAEICRLSAGSSAGRR